MTTILLYTYIIVAFIYIFFIFFCWSGWRRIPTQQSFAYNPTISVSIIIAARNEEKNILHCLEDLAEQNYPSAMYEVIVVDDDSQDETAALVNEFINVNSDKTFRLLQLQETIPGQAFKKLAITKGIAASRGQLIITTDADCRFPKKWVSSIVQHYEITRADMIAGPICFSTEKTMLAKLQSLEFMGLIGIGAGAMHNQLYIMCNGANLAYSKNTFNNAHGFDSNNTVASGDDTQLMLKIASTQKGKIRFLKSKEAIVYTDAKSSLADLLQQRKRWASKIPYHTSAFTLFIAVSAYLFHAGIIASALWMIIHAQFSWILALPIAGKGIMEFIFLYDLSRFFNRQKLLSLFLPAQIIYPFYIIIIGAISPFGTYQWKDRKVK